MEFQARALVDESNLELVEVGQLEENQPPNPAHAYQPDRGRHAWLFLWIGCFLMIALTWGFPFSYGVFQSYYSTHPPFSDDPDGLPAVGTTALGTLYLTSPPSFIILQRYQPYRRPALIVGSAVTCLAVLASAFATKVWHLLLTQGILYGLGASVVNTVTIQFLNEWFIERKGLAFGIQEAGAAMGGVVIPVLMTWGLEKYGHRNILIAWFVGIAILSLPSIYFLRERVRPRAAHTSEIGTLSFIATPIFLLLQAGNIFQALGNFLPGIHLPFNTDASIRTAVWSLTLGCGWNAIPLQRCLRHRCHWHGVPGRSLPRIGGIVPLISWRCRRSLLRLGLRGQFRGIMRICLCLRHVRRRLELNMGRYRARDTETEPPRRSRTFVGFCGCGERCRKSGQWA